MTTYTKTNTKKLRRNLVAGDVINDDGVMIVVETVETLTTHECRERMFGRKCPKVGNHSLLLTAINGDYDAGAADFEHTIYT